MIEVSEMINFFKKPEVKKSLQIAGQVTGAGLIGTAFFYSGYLDVAVLLLAKAGVVVVAGSVATQVAICAGVGIAAMSLMNAAWFLGKSVYQWFTPKTDFQKYMEKGVEYIENIKKLEDKATDCKTIIKTFNSLLMKAEKPNFDEKGMLTKEGQPVRNYLEVLRWKEKRLAQIVGTSNKRERAALKVEVTEKAKHKLEKPSKKPMFG